MNTKRARFGNVIGIAATSLVMLLAADGCGGSNDSGGSAGAAGSATGGSGGSGGGAGSSATGGSGGGAVDAGPPSFDTCFGDIYENPNSTVVPLYDKHGGNYNSTCSGTNNQDIQGVERVVFLGDSITVGPGYPTPANKVYRALLSNKLKTLFPGVTISTCAVDGATISDFFSGDNQIPKCFPTTEQKKTLTIFTMGGNDVKAIASKLMSPSDAQPIIDKMLSDLRYAVQWLKDPANFPNGSYVVFGNIYEYTDLTGDLDSCPSASSAGLSGQYLSAAALITQTREGYMQIAADTGTDMIYMGEDFCGHGFHNDDTASQCYRGPNTTRYFDITCIHPTDAGHAHLADMFYNTISE